MKSCTSDDICNAIRQLWPDTAAKRGVNCHEYAPLLDGHTGIGFSIRLFGPPTSKPNDSSRAAYEALEDMLKALEDMGFEVTREGNKWQTGRLVLGWSCRNDP